MTRDAAREHHRHEWEVCDDPLCCAGEKEWCEGCSSVRYRSRWKRATLRFPLWHVTRLVRYGEVWGVRRG